MKLNLAATEAQHESSVLSLAWNTTGTHILTVGESGDINECNCKGQLQKPFHVMFPQKLTTETQPVLQFVATNNGSSGYIFGDSEGKLYFSNEKGRIEKIIDAHEGNIIDLKWSHDNQVFFTVGEDAALKIWSLNGMLRSILVQAELPIFAASWSPMSDSVIYSQGKNLIIKPVSPNLKPTQFKAHEGVIRSIDWSSKQQLILSGGEDGKYKIWDRHGRLMYASKNFRSAITRVNWAPKENAFLVCAGEKLVLCDSSGWIYESIDLRGGSIYNLQWIEDGHAFAIGMAGGSVIIGHIFEKCIDAGEFSLTQIDATHISVNEASQLDEHCLEYKDSIVQFYFSFEHLIVLTTNQVYIHSSQHWITPIIASLPTQTSVRHVVMSATTFCLLDKSNQVHVYTFEGHPINSFSIHNANLIPERAICMHSDTLIHIDADDLSTIHMMDIQSGKQLSSSTWKHSSPITILAAFSGKMTGKYSSNSVIAFLDQQKHLWLYDIYRKEARKLALAVEDIKWNELNRTLCAIAEGKWRFWYYPASIFSDSELIQTASYSLVQKHLEHNARVQFFSGSQCSVRKNDGSIVHINGISPLIEALHLCFDKGDWDQAIRLCRYAKRQDVWSCLAAMALQSNDLNTAEVAYAAIEKTAKVKNICYIKDIANPDWQKAEIALLKSNFQEAEAILLSKNMVYRALFMWIELFEWDKAMELGLRYRHYLDVVLFFRENYLKLMGTKETKAAFLEVESKMHFDEEKTKEKIRNEEAKGR